ncbi:MAG: cytochrome c biogenesis protein CcdA, partial [bacterium]
MKTKCLNWPIKRWTIFLALIFLLPASALPKQFKDQKIVTVKGVISFDKLPRGKDFQLAIITHIAEGWHINAHVPSQDFLVPTELVFDKIEGISFGKIVYPLAIYKSFAFTESKLAVYEGEIAFAVPAHISDDFPLGKSQIAGSLHYQACNDQTCLPPSQAPFSIPIEVVPHDQPARVINEEIFSRFDFAGPKATSGAARKEYTAEELKAKQIIDKGLPYAIIAFFIVGLGLNLTPCVYPVIPITISFFGGQSDRRRGSSAVLALFYVIGIAIIFAVLGLVSGIAGKQWGFLFQNPWFVVIIVVIMLLLAASMFGAFEIRLPSRLMTTLGTARTGIIGSLIMGLTVGVVIAPCAAGVVIGLL